MKTPNSTNFETDKKVRDSCVRYCSIINASPPANILPVHIPSSQSPLTTFPSLETGVYLQFGAE